MDWLTRLMVIFWVLTIADIFPRGMSGTAQFDVRQRAALYVAGVVTIVWLIRWCIRWARKPDGQSGRGPWDAP
jgi:hypothetical protein